MMLFVLDGNMILPNLRFDILFSPVYKNKIKIRNEP